ncbi:helix-turn-helix domain-containing protein [Patescibacteria group bacterium]|nr:helix-turn-helix domain-containing protein [Patescibacteria group bacterium]
MPEVTYLGESEPVEVESLVRLRLITHNARLVDCRKELGMTGEDMAQAAKMARSRLRDIETLKAVPSEEDMIKIACILEKPIDYLFPEEVLSAVKAGVFSRRKVEIDAPGVISLTKAQQGRLAYDGETTLIEEISRTMIAEELKRILETLKPQYQQVLNLRFGLKDGHFRTLEEVGQVLL